MLFEDFNTYSRGANGSNDSEHTFPPRTLLETCGAFLMVSSFHALGKGGKNSNIFVKKKQEKNPRRKSMTNALQTVLGFPREPEIHQIFEGLTQNVCKCAVGVVSPLMNLGQAMDRVYPVFST